LLDVIENSIGDPVRDDSKDDEAVRAIARKMLGGVRREGARLLGLERRSV